MFTPFRLNKTIGETYNMDLEDSLNTKKALARLGYLETPDDGFDTYPDQALIDALKAFQRAEGLPDDGVMESGKETFDRLNAALEAQPAPSPPAPPRETSPPSLLGPASEPGSPLGRHLASLPARPGAAPPAKSKRPAPEGVQVTQAISVEDLLWLGILGGGALLTQQAGKQSFQKSTPPAANERTEMAPTFPPPPGYEPPKMHLPNLTEPATEPIDLPDLSQPIPDTKEPTIFILPTPDEGLQKAGTIVEDRRGSFETKVEIERIQAWIEKHHPDWIHEGGGFDRKEGKLKPEFWIPSVARVFGGDGRKGGTFVDLTFRTESGKLVHIQTVDVDPKTGKVTQDELDAADRIRRSGKNIDVILIPKGVQMDKFFKRSKHHQ